MAKLYIQLNIVEEGIMPDDELPYQIVTYSRRAEIPSPYEDSLIETVELARTKLLQSLTNDKLMDLWRKDSVK